MSTQTNNESTQSPGKGAFWLALLLILLFITLGFLVKKGYDLRLSGVERAQQEAARKNDVKFDQLSERVGAFTIDDSRVGGTVVVGDGSSTNGAGAGATGSSDGPKGDKGDTGAPGVNGSAGQDGATGPAGPAGATGATGPQGIQGPQGPSGVASCPNGTCLSLQGASPGAQEAGSINISGDGTFGGSVNATTITGDGSGVTNVNAATLNGITAGNGSGQIALSNGSLNTNLNADLLDGQQGSFYQNATNLNTGTLSDTRLSANVTLQGNAFNGASQLVQLTSGGILPILDGSQLTNVIAANSLQLGGQGAAYYLNASNLSSGTLSDALLSGNVTLQGNTFNGPNQLVRLTAGGILPVIDGSQLTNVNATTLNGQLAAYYLNATNINAGTLADGILSSNVPLKNATNTFSATNNFAGITATGILQNGYSVCDASNNCSYAASTGSTNYIWNGTSTQTANINIRSANPVNVGLVVQGATGQTANLQEWKNAAGSTVASINAAGDQFSFGGGTISVGSGNFTFNLNSIRVPSIRQNTGNLADLGANPLLTWSNTTSVPGVVVTPVASTQRGLAIRGLVSQSADLLQIQNSAGSVLASVSSAGAIFQGANQVCDTSNNCSYAATTGEAGYIQNQTAVPQAAGFSINGNGTIGGSLLVQGGISSPGSAANSQVFGAGATTGTGQQSLAVGVGALTTVNNQVAVGYNARVLAASSGGTAIGSGSTVNSQSGTALGAGATSTGNYAIALGAGSVTTGNGGVAIGGNGTTAAGNGIAIGTGSSATHISAISLGGGAATTANGQLVVGSSSASATFTNGYFGRGVVDATPGSFTFNATGGSGTDIQGGSIAIASGRGTGSANGGAILFQTSQTGQATGTTLRNLVTRAQIAANGNMSIGTTSDLGQLGVVLDSASEVGLAIQGVAGQTANLQEWRNNSGTMLSGVTATGIIQANAGIASTGTLVVNPANGILQLTASGSYNFGSAKGVWRSGSSGIRIGTGGNNLTVRNSADTADLFVILDTTGEITFTNNVRGYNVGVTSSAATTAVTFPTAHQNANYAVLCTPNWNTTCWVSDKTAAGFTLNYGTAAPSGQLVDWFVVH